MGNDFFDHFSGTVCSIRVTASYKSSDISLQFITESKLEVETVVPKLFGIVSFDRTFLVTFYVNYTAIDIDSN